MSPRGVQLGCLVMTGVEYALIVNEACGAPIPWLMSPPWLYFDGQKMKKIINKTNLNHILYFFFNLCILGFFAIKISILL